MKTRFLFPRQFKIIGAVLFVLGLLFFLADQHYNLNIFIWHNLRPNADSVSGSRDENFDDEIQLSFMLIGLMLLAFSKEKIEDEQIVHLRLESLQWAVYVNYAIFFIIIFTVYGIDFFAYALYNVLTLLLFFIIRFRWAIYRNNRLVKREAI